MHISNFQKLLHAKKKKINNETSKPEKDTIDGTIQDDDTAIKITIEGVISQPSSQGIADPPDGITFRLIILLIINVVPIIIYFKISDVGAVIFVLYFFNILYPITGTLGCIFGTAILRDFIQEMNTLYVYILCSAMIASDVDSVATHAGSSLKNKRGNDPIAIRKTLLSSCLFHVYINCVILFYAIKSKSLTSLYLYISIICVSLIFVVLSWINGLYYFKKEEIRRYLILGGGYKCLRCCIKLENTNTINHRQLSTVCE